jgi:pimeloyl-ACP methyl ester carboxylesterase
VASDVVTLPDGRQLSWYEFGDRDGAPVIYTAGTPVSGLGGGCYDETAQVAALRWISPDKPGYGHSDYHRERSLIGWGADLGALAGHLGLGPFALAGESGGAPFTLAAAHQLAGRVSAVVLLAAGGPIGPAERAGPAAPFNLPLIRLDTFGLVGWVRIGSAGIVGREHELSGSEFTRYELTSPYAATQGARLRRPASAARTP